jgi:hypothetical protein
MATTGVTCKITAQGWMAARNSELAAMATARNTPRMVAARSAVNVTVRVESRAGLRTL